MAFRNGMRPVHPGEVLREDFLAPLSMSVNALAKALGENSMQSHGASLRALAAAMLARRVGVHEERVVEMLLRDLAG